MTTAETFGRTIQVFLVDGSPNGLRKATIHGWTGAVLVASTSVFAKLTAREEANRTGVYVLFGSDPETGFGTRAYIGSANSVSDRIKQSAQKHAFWETAIAITTSDDDLSKGHAEYLEARLIQMAVRARRVSLENGTQPEIEKRRLPEADRANMEQFLANLKVILPVVGLEMIKPQPNAVTQTGTPVPARIASDVKFEIRHKSGVQARAVEEDGEFIVIEDSEALTGTGGIMQSYGGLKAKLLADGVHVASGTRLRFARPYPFSSPSAAAAVVLDRNSNGRIEWKVEGSKLTYHDWQQTTEAAQETVQ